MVGIGDLPLPHDRGFMLWTNGRGTQRLAASIDRWASAMLSDDGLAHRATSSPPDAEFTIITRQDGVLAGVWAVDRVFERWSEDVDRHWFALDGDRVESGQVLASLAGPKESILQLERSVLNILGRLSGIATASKKWIEHSPIPIACTRKTTWGLLDKWAVHLGGGLTHRLSKVDAMMLKENDLVQSGLDQVSTIEARLAETHAGDIGGFLTIEVRSVDEALAAALTWAADERVGRLVIMLDNLGPTALLQADRMIRDAGVRGRVVLEGSGQIRFDDLDDWTGSGVDVLSSSSVNRGVPHLDISMLVEGA